MENTSTSNKQTAQVRLDELIEDLDTTDTILAKEIDVVYHNKKHYNISKISSYRASGGNKPMKPDFLEDMENALPFLNMDWFKHGLGNWLNKWSPKQKKDYITKSQWYKDKPKETSQQTEDLCSSKKEIDKLLKNGTDTNFRIILRSKFATTYATGSRIRSDINKDLCKRVRYLRESRKPTESQTYFAETTMGIKKSTVTNIEILRQNPPIAFIKKLKEKCSIDPKNRLSYDWLLDGVGDMIIDQGNLPLPDRTVEIPNKKDKIDKELCNRIDKIREDKDMSKTAFANHLEVNREMISAMAGKRKRQNPTTWFLSRLKERVTDSNKILSYDWILDGVGPQYIENPDNSESSNDSLEELRQQIERLKRENERLRQSK